MMSPTKNILLRFPEIWESKKNEMTEGSIAMVERIIKYKTIERGFETKLSRLAALLYKKDTDINKTYKNIFGLLKAYLIDADDETVGETTLVPPPEMDPEIIRRICEVIYTRKGAGKATIHIC